MAHFNKLECFCFTEHMLKPGESKQWPVVFVVDRKLPKDVKTITLSYTFFEVGGKTPAEPAAPAAPRRTARGARRDRASDAADASPAARKALARCARCCAVVWSFFGVRKSKRPRARRRAS